MLGTVVPVDAAGIAMSTIQVRIIYLFGTRKVEMKRAAH
jgi:hypothetical protein